MFGDGCGGFGDDGVCLPAPSGSLTACGCAVCEDGTASMH